jgi:hypothetical protein
MYPMWPVECVVELLGGEGLAGSRVNIGAPACQTGASWRWRLALEMALVSKDLCQ